MEDRDDNKNNVIKKLPKSGFKRKSFGYLLIRLELHSKECKLRSRVVKYNQDIKFKSHCG